MAHGLHSPTADSRLYCFACGLLGRAQDLLPADPLPLKSKLSTPNSTNSLTPAHCWLKADSFVKPWHGPHRKHFCWCVWCGITCSIVVSLVCLAPDCMATPLPHLSYWCVTSQLLQSHAAYQLLHSNGSLLNCVVTGLQCHNPAMAASAGFTILDFSRHATVFCAEVNFSEFLWRWQ
jgi:hypothetical protein